MKRLSLFYWISTGLAAGVMLLSGIPNLISNADSVVMVVDHLKYPAYFLPMIGLCKMAGAIVLVIPGFPRLKEWAYAGLVFDLGAAVYSFYSVGDPFLQWLPMFLFIGLIFASYYFHHQRLSAAAK